MDVSKLETEMGTFLLLKEHGAPHAGGTCTHKESQASLKRATVHLVAVVAANRYVFDLQQSPSGSQSERTGFPADQMHRRAHNN
jgi:hypothetical protein